MLDLRVKEVAMGQGLTPTTLAERAGIRHQTAMNLWRGGLARIDLSTLAKVAEALGVSDKDLLVEIPKNNTTPVAV